MTAVVECDAIVEHSSPVSPAVAVVALAGRAPGCKKEKESLVVVTCWRTTRHVSRRPDVTIAVSKAVSATRSSAPDLRSAVRGPADGARLDHLRRLRSRQRDRARSPSPWSRSPRPAATDTSARRSAKVTRRRFAEGHDDHAARQRRHGPWRRRLRRHDGYWAAAGGSSSRRRRIDVRSAGPRSARRPHRSRLRRWRTCTEFDHNGSGLTVRPGSATPNNPIVYSTWRSAPTVSCWRRRAWTTYRRRLGEDLAVPGR